jgi:hypothetical protein
MENGIGDSINILLKWLDLSFMLWNVSYYSYIAYCNPFVCEVRAVESNGWATDRGSNREAK